MRRNTCNRVLFKNSIHGRRSKVSPCHYTYDKSDDTVVATSSNLQKALLR